MKENLRIILLQEQKLNEINLELLSRYPFLPELKEYLKNIEFDIEKILKTENVIIKNSIERIKLIIKGSKEIKIEDPETEIQIFVVTLYLVSQLGSLIIQKFADYESKKCSVFLKEENIENLVFLAKNFLNFNVSIEETKKDFLFLKFIGISLLNYLNYASYLSGYKWSLAFKEIKSGKVYISTKELARLIEEGYRQWIIVKCNEIKDIYFPEVQKYISEINKEIKNLKIKNEFRINIKNYKGNHPPCIRILINDLKEGKKLSHMGRFALVTYLRKIGWDVEDVISLFRNLPDFKEDITRYQVEHIFGLRGGRKAYEVPSCLTMKVGNLCYPESPGCDNIKHPLQYILKSKK